MAQVDNKPVKSDEDNSSSVQVKGDEENVPNEPERGDVENSPKKRIKLDPPVEGTTDKKEKIKKQLEYYFSDVNIVNDKFLLEEIKKDNGWVRIETLLTFARLKELAKDIDEVIQAIKEKDSDILDVDESKKSVKRKVDMPNVEKFREALKNRTVHISGFPTDYTFENLNKFCQQFGEIESIMMRRHYNSRAFKGNIHAVFKKEEDAKKVLETEPFKCKDRELRRESMDNYYKRKEEFYRTRKEKRKEKVKQNQ